MILGAAIVFCAVAAGWLTLALWLSQTRGLTFRQALLYAPLKLWRRVSDVEAAKLRAAGLPVIYAIRHQSGLDPALALSLLPPETLHILDQQSAKAVWLEPWRELARTISFNAEHLFVSRRLVRHLKGKGRLAVYLPSDIRPDTKEFRLYRAISRIAANSGASVLPIEFTPEGLLGGLTVKMLPALTIAELTERSPAPAMSHALFNRVEEVRLRAAA